MAGEMSQSEVTRESYPLLFALRDSLKRRGIDSEPRAFDQYQGPYLYVPGRCKVWYDPNDAEQGRVFLLENRENGKLFFETVGADVVFQQDKRNMEHGVYTLRQASKRIASLASIRESEEL